VCAMSVEPINKKTSLDTRRRRFSPNPLGVPGIEDGFLESTTGNLLGEGQNCVCGSSQRGGSMM
jgi:hypothetical protein